MGERRNKGVFYSMERVMHSRWIAPLALGSLLGTFDVTLWQATLIVVLFVNLTTDAPPWLKAERATTTDPESAG